MTTPTVRVEGFTDVVVPPPPVVITFTDLHPDSFDGGTLSIQTRGDFDGDFDDGGFGGEWIDMWIDDISLGRIWDRDPANDQFVSDQTSPDNDRGSRYFVNGSNISATAVLSETQLDEVLADGEIDVRFEFGPLVQEKDFGEGLNEFVEASIVYQFDDAVAVPEPACGALASIAAGMALLSRRRRRSSR
ncbi:MAG: hypothetical protein AAGA03_01005 [Planctomycetota bacterium]